MVSCKGLAALLLLGLCAAASARELQAKKAVTYANLYDAVTKAKLVTLRAAIDAAGLKKAFQNPNLNATLFAPNEAAWQRFFNDCKAPKNVKEVDVAKYCSLNALKAANKAELKQFVQYMAIYGNAPAKAGNSWWPIQTTKTVFHTPDTLFNRNIMRLRYKAPNFEAHGTGRDAFIVQANLAVGTQGLMHIVDNVVTYYPEKKKP